MLASMHTRRPLAEYLLLGMSPAMTGVSPYHACSGPRHHFAAHCPGP